MTAIHGWFCHDTAPAQKRCGAVQPMFADVERHSTNDLRTVWVGSVDC